MKPSSLLALYERLEKLVQRLPESLQQPILREITPIKTLFLLQRAPRLVLLGESGAGKIAFLHALFGKEIAHLGEENLSDGNWRAYGRNGRGFLRILDARRPASIKLLHASLAAERPDLFVYLQGEKTPAESSADLEHAAQILELVTTAKTPEETPAPRLLGVLASGVPGSDLGPEKIERARQDLHAALHATASLSDRMVGTLAMSTAAEISRLAELLALELPGEAQLEMARLSGNQALQRQIAQVLIKSITAICAAVGAQPIPLADFPILTSLQAAMVAGIMHISGREMNLKLASEFLAAVGTNVGLGLVLREGTRAALKFVPLWGNAVSGGVAGAGTYAIGRAAVAYFVDGVSLPDARLLFRRRRKKPPLLTD